LVAGARGNSRATSGEFAPLMGIHNRAAAVIPSRGSRFNFNQAKNIKAKSIGIPIP
jgi:hypothetical protein